MKFRREIDFLSSKHHLLQNKETVSSLPLGKVKQAEPLRGANGLQQSMYTSMLKNLTPKCLQSCIFFPLLTNVLSRIYFEADSSNGVDLSGCFPQHVLISYDNRFHGDICKCM